MLYFAQGAPDARLSSDDLQRGLYEALGALGPRRKVLVLPPDATRFHSRADELTRRVHEFYGAAVKDILPSIGTHAAMTPGEIPAYSAAKAAVSNFTQWLAVHLSKAGIRVNAIAAGFFLTDQNRALLTQPDGALTARGKTILGHTPMGRFGTPDDLSGALLWLASDEAAGFVTGTAIAVDGGFAAFSGV